MNLAIDRGNTSTKVAVFDEHTLLYHEGFSIFGEQQMALLLKKYPINKVIFSSVATDDVTLVTFLRSNVESFLELTNDTPLPIKLDYETPQTLGCDRIAALVGARAVCSQGTLLVMDLGTCNTYDVLTADDIFIGGNIAPGFEMRLKAMHAFTGKLPLLSTEIPRQLLGRSTQEAIISGAYWGILYELEQLIVDVKQKYNDISVFLTGGTAFYFEKQIKNRIFAEPNLVLIGLNEILIYNDIY